uniref:Histidine phosphatase superfamily branch 1 n=1 Tax=Pithovirus LCPAC103 TaxID=2506588 RepID=A0A481Z6X6_9VIRU|nr:MAG: histidine phosphatase superfamily branch 1 [Pithovirus LCPAC103]
MDLKKLTLIRHAQPKSGSEPDPQLSEPGCKQAAELSGHYQLVVLGPLRRHLDTYVNSDISGDRMAMSELLREQKMGDKAYNYYRNEDQNLETRADVMVRVKELKAWLRLQPETEICLITSAFFMCYFIDSCGVPRGLINYCQRFELEM